MPVPSESKARVRNTTGTAKRQGSGSANRKNHICPKLKGYKDLTSAEHRVLSDKATTMLWFNGKIQRGRCLTNF